MCNPNLLMLLAIFFCDSPGGLQVAFPAVFFGIVRGLTSRRCMRLTASFSSAGRKLGMERRLVEATPSALASPPNSTGVLALAAHRKIRLERGLRGRRQLLRPGKGGVRHGDEVRVQQIPLVVGQRGAVKLAHGAAGSGEHGIRSGDVPLRGGAKAGV